jgi:general secretion pathway protein A
MILSPAMTTAAPAIPPFSINPDPSLLYLTPGLEAALHKTRYVIENRQGLTAIFGDVGLGKSTVLRYLYQSYAARDDCRTAFLHTPSYKSEFAFLKAICADFDIPIRPSQQRQESELNGFLIEQLNEGRLVVLFVDEAQKLPGSQLELVRTLLNFEDGRVKLIQIVLAAQLEIKQKLADPSKKAIRSRIFAPSMLDALTLSETMEMIAFRCQRAGIQNPFEAGAVEAVYRVTGGVPREILKVCSIALEMARAQGAEKIGSELVQALYPEAVYVSEE